MINNSVIFLQSRPVWNFIFNLIRLDHAHVFRHAHFEQLDNIVQATHHLRWFPRIYHFHVTSYGKYYFWVNLFFVMSCCVVGNWEY